ncbi:hypothetical protein BGZ94_007318, partial [Podila epigama]
MSWQEYVDNNLVGSKVVTKACILGLDGSLWATSAGFQIGSEEATKLIAAFNDSSDASAHGIYVQGIKFVVLRASDVTILARA